VIRAIAEAARSRDKRVGFMGRIEFGFLDCEWVLLRESNRPYDLGQEARRRTDQRLAKSKKVGGFFRTNYVRRKKRRCAAGFGEIRVFQVRRVSTVNVE
jgi:hypothetical protein